MNDRQNRQRWAVDQQEQARTEFAKQLPSAEHDRAARLAELKVTAELMVQFPHMAASLAAVKKQIAELSNA